MPALCIDDRVAKIALTKPPASAPLTLRRPSPLRPTPRLLRAPRGWGSLSMLFEDWRDQVVAIARRRLPKPEEPLQWYQTALADIFWLMESAPDETQAYEAIDEAALQADAEVRAMALDGAAPAAWDPNPTGSAEELMLSLAVEARALDSALWDFRDKAAPDDPDTAYRVDHEREVYLIPRLRYPGRRRPPRNREPFTRRGLLHHRIFPRELGGATVRLVQAPRTHSWEDEIVVGGALFKDLTLHPKPVGERRFLVDRVICEDQEAQLDDHLEHCVRGDPCTAVVWPELTLAPALQAKVATYLKDLAQDRAAKRPGLALLGSWHEQDDGKFRNVTHIYSGYGTQLASYAKMRRFSYLGREEAIEIGRDLPIVLIDDMLVAFGICKDFCDRHREYPYQKLDIDLVLVPSFGSAATMNHHLVTAAQIRVQYGAFAFVAQQALKLPVGGQGWIAGLLDDPADYTARDVVKPEGFETFSRATRWERDAASSAPNDGRADETH